jgi:CheY-like chemotaxis protein
MGQEDQTRPVVLVVEDDELMLMDAVEVVSQAGFEAVAATNADDAIMILERRNDIGVIFTDINMPGSMDGLKLARAVRNRWPPIDIIVTSGGNLASERLLPDRGVFIPKPYTPSQISSALYQFVSR